MRTVWSCLAVIACVAGCSNSDSVLVTEDGGAGAAWVGTWTCKEAGSTPATWTWKILENANGTLAVAGGPGGDSGTCNSTNFGVWEIAGTTATPGTVTCTQGDTTTTVSPITITLSGSTLTFSETVTSSADDAGTTITATCTKS
jgi:hypothetical protein